MGGEKAVSLFCGDLRGREYGMKSVVAGEAPPTAEASKTLVKQMRLQHIISVSVVTESLVRKANQPRAQKYSQKLHDHFKPMLRMNSSGVGPLFICAIAAFTCSCMYAALPTLSVAFGSALDSDVDPMSSEPDLAVFAACVSA